MIKNLLLQLGDDERVDARTQAALAVAKRFGAHVAGLHPLARQVPGFADVAARERTRQDAGRTAEARFLAAAAAAGVSAEAHVEAGEPSELLLAWGRSADLAVLGQAEPEGAPSPAEDVLLALGRPALVIPFVGAFPTVGEAILLAWNGTRESALAAQAALPFLVRAGKVTVVGYDLDGPQRAGARRVVASLARHGVEARLDLSPLGDLPIGDALLNAAFELGADLLVMGAYGRSRMRERVFGGATRSLLTQMTVPALFAH